MIPKPYFHILMQRKTLIALLILITVGAFSAVISLGFVNWDDPAYVISNPLIKSLSIVNIKNIFLSTINGNYHPLTTLSFAIEYKFFGLKAHWMHLTNLLLHLCNAFLVFKLLEKVFPQQLLLVFLTSLLFAIHPTRVESVAWVTERKDVLFAFFYLMALWKYISWGPMMRIKQHVFLTVLFLASLLSKVSAVSLPLIFILYDAYAGKLSIRNSLSKIHYFVIAICFGVFALLSAKTPFVDQYIFGVQEASSYIIPEPYMIWDRLFLTANAILQYMIMLIFPFNLSPFYPYPASPHETMPIVVYVSGLVFFWLFIILPCVLGRFQRPFLYSTVFFILTIMFNLPIWNIGYAIVADRFTYIPFLGFFILMASGLCCFLRLGLKSPFRLIPMALIIVMLFSLTYQTQKQVLVWRDSESLWSNVLLNFPGESKAYYNRGNFYFEKQEWSKALSDFNSALRFQPDLFQAHNNIGSILSKLGRHQIAIKAYSAAINLNPHYYLAYINRSKSHYLLGHQDESLKDIQAVLSIDPMNSEARQFLQNKLMEPK